MFVFFYHAGLPAWLIVPVLTFIIFCIFLTFRGAYILAKTKSFRSLLYSFGVFSIIWATFMLTGSKPLEKICVLFTLPFGIFAGIPLLLLSKLNLSMAYFGGAFLNLLAIGGAFDLIKKFRARRLA